MPKGDDKGRVGDEHLQVAGARTGRSLPGSRRGVVDCRHGDAGDAARLCPGAYRQLDRRPGQSAGRGRNHPFILSTGARRAAGPVPDRRRGQGPLCDRIVSGRSSRAFRVEGWSFPLSRTRSSIVLPSRATRRSRTSSSGPRSNRRSAVRFRALLCRPTWRVWLKSIGAAAASISISNRRSLICPTTGSTWCSRSARVARPGSDPSSSSATAPTRRFGSKT